VRDFKARRRCRIFNTDANPLRVAFVHVERTFLAFQKKIGCLSALSGSLGRGTPRPCGAVFGKLGLGWRMEGMEGFLHRQPTAPWDTL